MRQGGAKNVMRKNIGIFFIGVAFVCFFSYFLISNSKIKTSFGYSFEGKKTVVITHGGLANAETMLAWSNAFSDQGYAITLLDLPNHGNWYEDSIKYSTAKDIWSKVAHQSSPKIAIGHSLGGQMIENSKAPHLIRIGSGSRNKKWNYYGSLFPLYSIDHLLEPWNPILIERVLKDLKIKINDEHKIKIWGYCLLPWFAFIFGITGGILVLPIFRKMMAKRFGVAATEERFSILFSALFLIAIFVITTCRSLWNTSIFSLMEFGIFFICTGFAYIISRTISRWSLILSTFCVWGWCLGWTFFLSQVLIFWPGKWLMNLHVMLMVIVAAITFVCSRLLELETNHARDITGVLMFAYALAVLTPKLFL